MEFILEFTKITVQSFVLGFSNPIFIVSIFIIYIQLKEVQMDSQLSTLDIRKVLFDSVMFGIFFAFIGSIASSILGIFIKIDYSMIHIVAIIPIIITIFNLLNINISYVFPIIVILDVMLKESLDLRGLLSLCGMIFIIQSILIASFGTKNIIPTVVKRQNKYVGAYYSSSYWPVPIAFLIMSILQNNNLPAQSVTFNEPFWWPLLSVPTIGESETFFYTLASIPIIISFKDLYVYDKPERIIKYDSFFYFVFGIAILSTACLVNYIPILYMISFILPIIYELFILNKWNKSVAKKPYFDTDEIGIKVLYTLPGGMGEKIRIKRGDLILSVNGFNIQEVSHFKEVLEKNPKFLNIVIKRDNKNIVLEHSFFPKGINDLDIVYIENISTQSINLVNENKLLTSLYLLFRQKNM